MAGPFLSINGSRILREQEAVLSAIKGEKNAGNAVKVQACHRSDCCLIPARPETGTRQALRRSYHEYADSSRQRRRFVGVEG